MQVIHCDDAQSDALQKAVASLRTASNVAALTGAGLSVGSGIPDFRSPGGLWTVFNPDEYATLEVFYENPAKAWKLYRALGKVLIGRQPNEAHLALACLEEVGLMKGIVTQNVDNLHQQAGSEIVFEIHGEHQRLQCLKCGHLEQVRDEHFLEETIPHCPQCQFPLKPNVVLFGEPVRDFDEIERFMAECDLLFVVGTSAQVYPAASIPLMVKQNGGMIFEFNQEPALGFDYYSGVSTLTDYFFHGDVRETLPLLTRALGDEQ